MDQFYGRLGGACCRDPLPQLLEEGFAFDITGVAKPRGDDVEIAVIIAGVADQLPGAFRQSMQKSAQCRLVQVTCRGDTDGSVRRDDPALAQSGKPLEAAAHPAG